MHAEINARHTEMLLELKKLHSELVEEVDEFKTDKLESFAREIVEPLTHMIKKRNKFIQKD
jgi:hypothetical protein